MLGTATRRVDYLGGNENGKDCSAKKTLRCVPSIDLEAPLD